MCELRQKTLWLAFIWPFNALEHGCISKKLILYNMGPLIQALLDVHDSIIPQDQ